jgi:hypothetical protein
MTIFTPRFWRETIERAVKSVAQGALVALGASSATPVDLFDVAAGPIVGIALGMGVVSVLTSVASAKVGPDEHSPSVV